MINERELRRLAGHGGTRLWVMWSAEVARYSTLGTEYGAGLLPCRRSPRSLAAVAVLSRAGSDSPTVEMAAPVDLPVGVGAVNDDTECGGYAESCAGPMKRLCLG